MLQVKDICKQYKTGDLVQQALDHVSLNLRDNEFVAILGPSGSGKTTLLNIIGGLDRYDSGDLIINGISTKKYKDRDWDSYRNHTIGFVFQSYNLIPHQTVLANVELALTISGVSGSERRRRAEEALKKVGLGSQMHKKPNQMSGGQMQRVAIARALVNNPDILLADEPTGALDSETSVQVMDLLKEVARDRLVVMVTHNPDLAYQYANRIINLKDGHITADSNPYQVDEEALSAPAHKNMGKASMSFLTALSLSFNNLLTKKARTILVAFAGSIGIIGIALIMSLSNGVNQYIKNTEQESLAEYPLEIDSTSFSLASVLNGEQEKSENKDGEVKERQVVTNMFSRMTSNDLASLKKYIDSDQSNLKDYARSVEYKYNVSPQIYRMNGDELIQVNPNTLLSSSGIAPTSSAYSSSFSMDVFTQLPEDKSLYENSYEVKAGRWPEKENELVVILNQNGEISDMVSYTLGLKNYDELKDLIESSENGTIKASNDQEDTYYAYSDLLGQTFRLINAGDEYTYDDSLGVWSDRSSDTDYMKSLYQKSEELKVVGVVQPAEGTDISMLNEGIGYTSDLIKHVMKTAEDLPAVQAQLANKDINIFTGQAFGSETNDIDLSSIISVDQNALQNAFKVDTSPLSFDSTDSFTNALSLPDMSAADLNQLLSSVDLSELKNIDLNKIMQDLLNAYAEEYGDTYKEAGQGLLGYLKDNAGEVIINDLNSFIEANGNRAEITEKMNQLYAQLADAYVRGLNGSVPEDITADFLNYLNTEDARNQISAAVNEVVNSFQLSDAQKEQLKTDLLNGYNVYASENGYPDTQQLTDSFSSFLSGEKAGTVVMNDLNSMVDVSKLTSSISSALSSVTSSYMNSISSSVSSALQKMMGSYMNQLGNAFTFDPSVFESAVQINMSADQLQEAMSSMMSSQRSSYENNMKQLGYADENDPSSILIYPYDFDAKNEVKSVLDSYNQSMEDAGEEDKVISYTDMVATLMGSVTKIVNTVSWALIAFVAISLIVSSIMIGVITYISVLERRKEIGILRAIGASKHNVSEVFNAETFITGLLAGVIGVGIALLLLIPANQLIAKVAERSDIRASLPIQYGLGLIVLSIVLTLISGLIPARKAANSDPVTALRTE